MSYLPPDLALIDDDLARSRRFARLARQVGTSLHTFRALPLERVIEHGRIRGVVDAFEFTIPGMLQLRTIFPHARIIVSCANTSQEAAIAAFRSGADDFIPHNVNDCELKALLRRHLGNSPVEWMP